MSSGNISNCSLHCPLSKLPTTPPLSTISFKPFPLLPPEIRLKIWRSIAFTPRDVELSTTIFGGWLSPTPIPALFHICVESRSVAIATYTSLALHCPIPCKQNIYVNFLTDTICLCSNLELERIRKLLVGNELLKREMRSLAVKEHMWKRLNGTWIMPISTRMQAYGGFWYEYETWRAVVSGLKALEDVRFY